MATEPVEPSPEVLAACRAAHERFFGGIADFDDATVRRPSRLAGWSVGHVLTHVARNADSFTRMLEAAGEGRSVMQYEGGASGRAADIEEGAGRPAAEIVSDVIGSSTRLDAAFEAATAETWSMSGTTVDGRAAPCSRLPLRRIREVEIHHVDLGTGYLPADWPDSFVALTLDEVLSTLRGRISDPRQRAELLAWATGRSDWPGRLDLEAW